MKAFIYPNTAPIETINGTRAGWFADVVSETDYHERGAFAKSYRSAVHEKRIDAELDATLWARDHGYAVVGVEEVAR